MKKYVVAISIVAVVAVAIVIFQIPDRINYAINDMCGYNLDYYTISKEEISDACEINLNMKKYIKEEKVLLEREDGLQLILTDVEYLGKAYKLYIKSVGTSSFDNGRIISLDEISDFKVDSNCGKLYFQKTGAGPSNKNTEAYEFDIYPLLEVDTKKLPNLKCQILLSGLKIINYTRG